MQNNNQIQFYKFSKNVLQHLLIGWVKYYCSAKLSVRRARTHQPWNKEEDVVPWGHVDTWSWQKLRWQYTHWAVQLTSDETETQVERFPRMWDDSGDTLKQSTDIQDSTTLTLLYHLLKSLQTVQHWHWSVVIEIILITSSQWNDNHHLDQICFNAVQLALTVSTNVKVVFSLGFLAHLHLLAWTI